MHGTFVAGILCAKRGSAAPAICPACTLLTRPIFSETTSANEPIPSATPEELAAAIIECIDAGARLVNVSAALAQLPSSRKANAHWTGARLCRKARRYRRGRSRQPRNGWKHGHYAASLGHSGHCLRPARQAAQRIEPGKFHWSARVERAWRGHHKPWHRGQSNSLWRNQCCRSVCNRGNRIGVVGVSYRQRKRKLRMAVTRAHLQERANCRSRLC